MDRRPIPAIMPVMDHASDTALRAATGPATLDCQTLRWRCDGSQLGFTTTADVEPELGIIGQDTAVEALMFGLECRAPGQNVFVRGLAGTGRLTLVRRLLKDMAPTCPEARDRCFVHNFAREDEPHLISLPRGSAKRFAALMNELADFVRDELRPALGGESIAARRNSLEATADGEIRQLLEPFDQELKEAGFAVVTVQAGPASRATVFPRIDDEPVPPERLEQLRAEGKIDEEKFSSILERRAAYDKRLAALNDRILEIREKHAAGVRDMLSRETRVILWDFVRRVTASFDQPDVVRYLEGVVDDVVANGLRWLANPQGEDFTRRYRVNVVLGHDVDHGSPVIIENTPTLMNLLGGVDREVMGPGVSRSDHLMVRPGSLLRADGGYLIMEARDVLTEPGAWKVLVRTLRAGRLEIVPPEMAASWFGQPIKPEPIDVDVKVVLLGDAQLFAALDAMDPDFPHLFKLLADFETEIARDDDGLRSYAGVLARVAKEDDLAPFAAGAVAELVEHGARIAAQRGMLTARFGRVIDVAREAAFVAGKQGADTVAADHVREAIRRAKRRVDLPARRFREAMSSGVIRVETTGARAGQVNGLAVLHAGALTTGFPSRITATVGPGTRGVINIEREAALSGAIHTKGFYILGGLLRHLLQTDHALTFDASIAFEQSYGGIDGDSASGAETCCLLSALADVPIRQDRAMTGAIDQMGNIMAIGAVNEKIEGFYDCCRGARQGHGLTGEQGVIIPRSNVADMMLRTDVVESCAAGRFHVWAVDTIHEAIELLMNVEAGVRGDDGYPDGTLLGRCVDRARQYWARATAGSAVVGMLAEAAVEGAGDDRPDAEDDPSPG